MTKKKRKNHSLKKDCKLHSFEFQLSFFGGSYILVISLYNSSFLNGVLKNCSKLLF